MCSFDTLKLAGWAQSLPRHCRPAITEAEPFGRLLCDVAAYSGIGCHQIPETAEKRPGAPANAQMEPDIEEARLTSSAFRNEHVGAERTSRTKEAGST